jgi:hypothetical protein
LNISKLILFLEIRSPGLPLNRKKPWHNDSYSHTRRDIKLHIFEFLRARRPYATTEQSQQMSTNFEDILYNEAKSFQEYSDRNSLNKRVQRLTSSLIRNNYKAQIYEEQQSPPSTRDHLRIDPRLHAQHELQRTAGYESFTCMSNTWNQPFASTTEAYAASPFYHVPPPSYSSSRASPLLSSYVPPPPFYNIPSAPPTPRPFFNAPHAAPPPLRSNDIPRDPDSSTASLSVAGSEMKPWHTSSHIQAREEIRILITKLLRYSRSDPTIEWLNNLPGLTRRLEEKLYCESTSFQEYHDRNTLKERLQQVVASPGSRSGRTHAQPPPSSPTSSAATVSMIGDLFAANFVTVTQLVPISQNLPVPPLVSSQYFVADVESATPAPALIRSRQKASPPLPAPPAPPPIEDDRTCIICLDHPRTHLIMPCFHFIACSDCIQNFAVGSECPVCRTRVMETKQVFYS